MEKFTLKSINAVYSKTGELPPNLHEIYTSISEYLILSNTDFLVDSDGIAEKFIAYNETNIHEALDELNLSYTINGKINNSPIVEVW